MLILAVLLTCILLALLYFFFAPFYVEINSIDGLFRLRFHRLCSIALKWEHDLTVETTILGWKFERTFFTKTFEHSAEKDQVRPGSTRVFPLKKLVRVLSSFKVNKFYMNVDFGDMQLNGVLYPVVAWISWYSRKNIQINFSGRTVVILEIENSLARMSRAWVSSKL